MTRSNIFRYRLDEVVHPDSASPKKRPDGVYGLNSTEYFDRFLFAANPIVRSLPFREKVGSPHFPFLVLEAKSEENSREDFPQMLEQTKPTIFTLLKLQADLRARACIDEQWPCPFVWYLAFKGERWRLYASYWLDQPAEALSVSSQKCLAGPKTN